MIDRLGTDVLDCRGDGCFDTFNPADQPVLCDIVCDALDDRVVCGDDDGMPVRLLKNAVRREYDDRVEEQDVLAVRKVPAPGDEERTSCGVPVRRRDWTTRCLDTDVAALDCPVYVWVAVPSCGDRIITCV
jgi:hypothetical protein